MREFVDVLLSAGSTNGNALAVNQSRLRRGNLTRQKPAGYARFLAEIFLSAQKWILPGNYNVAEAEWILDVRCQSSAVSVRMRLVTPSLWRQTKIASHAVTRLPGATLS
jgi:hypothetical protein